MIKICAICVSSANKPDLWRKNVQERSSPPLRLTWLDYIEDEKSVESSEKLPLYRCQDLYVLAVIPSLDRGVSTVIADGSDRSFSRILIDAVRRIRRIAGTAHEKRTCCLRLPLSAISNPSCFDLPSTTFGTNNAGDDNVTVHHGYLRRAVRYARLKSDCAAAQRIARIKLLIAESRWKLIVAR